MWFIILLMLVLLAGVLLWGAVRIEQSYFINRLERLMEIQHEQWQSEMRIQQAAQGALQRMLDEARRR